MTNRIGRAERATKETQVAVELDLDGTGTADVSTGVPFFDHMLQQLAKHGRIDLRVKAAGDIEIDAHHTVEDTAITLGEALRQALGDKAGICRFGDALVPLDETLVRAAVDLAGPPVCCAQRAGRHGAADRQLRHDLDQAFLRDLGCDGRDLRAPGRAVGTESAPHRRSAVQGVRAGAASCRGG